MRYRIEIMPHAARQMKRLPEDIRKRIDGGILELSDNPRPAGFIKLQGEANAWRIRVGDYRIIYEIHDAHLLVQVIRVDHRNSVYR